MTTEAAYNRDHWTVTRGEDGSVRNDVGRLRFDVFGSKAQYKPWMATCLIDTDYEPTCEGDFDFDRVEEVFFFDGFDTKAEGIAYVELWLWLHEIPMEV